LGEGSVHTGRIIDFKRLRAGMRELPICVIDWLGVPLYLLCFMG
jgi:hypothetical protein